MTVAGRVEASAAVAARPAPRSYKAFSAPTTVLANQPRTPSMSLSANQPPMSAPDPALDDGEQDRCEDSQGVADQG
jgi:hypothetical protein